jgi:hypothetical protein|tara:strand:+ start:859 stop:1146 length:288 start_codon:yes stop_codon:yes gene_type:complete
METIYNKIVNGEVVDCIVSDAAFIATQEGTWELRATPPPPTTEETSRDWRDQELSNTDFWASITDHPQYSDRMAYRVALRDWPSTSDFPDTKPTL